MATAPPPQDRRELPTSEAYAPVGQSSRSVTDKIATIVNQFPRDARPPVIQKFDPDSQPILGFAVLKFAFSETPRNIGIVRAPGLEFPPRIPAHAGLGFVPDLAWLSATSNPRSRSPAVT